MPTGAALPFSSSCWVFEWSQDRRIGYIFMDKKTLSVPEIIYNIMILLLIAYFAFRELLESV